MSITRRVRKPSFMTSVAIQIRVVSALTVRVAQAKYTRETFGFFWTIAEPLILTLGVISLWAVSGRAEGHSTVKVFPFALTAYSHIQLWRYSVNGSMGTIKRNAWLFYHQHVHVVDMFLAHIILESIAILTSFSIIAFFGVMFGLMDPPSDYGLLLTAWGADTLFCLSFASVVAGLSEFSEIVEKLLHPLMYLTLPLTGSFALASWLPPRVRVIVEWSPLANACEMFRAGVFPPSVKTIWSLPFIVGCSVALLVIGLPLMMRARKWVDIA
ncbi:ABC transporter permease [Roseiarcus fermentans]|nr:ABC transporter permease [Roseiarcus fermentans]